MYQSPRPWNCVPRNWLGVWICANSTSATPSSPAPVYKFGFAAVPFAFTLGKYCPSAPPNDPMSNPVPTGAHCVCSALHAPGNTARTTARPDGFVTVPATNPLGLAAASAAYHAGVGTYVSLNDCCVLFTAS